MSDTKDEVLECAEAYEALGEPVGASYLRAYAALLGSEPVGFVTSDGFPALYGHKPLMPGTKLFSFPRKEHKP